MLLRSKLARDAVKGALEQAPRELRLPRGRDKPESLSMMKGSSLTYRLNLHLFLLHMLSLSPTLPSNNIVTHSYADVAALTTLWICMTVLNVLRKALHGARVPHDLRHSFAKQILSDQHDNHGDKGYIADYKQDT